MEVYGNNVIVNKEAFVVNALFTGNAVQILARNSDFSEEHWMQYLNDLAEKQLKKMTPGQIDKMIQTFLDARQ